MHHWIGVHLPRLPIESFCPTWYMPVSDNGFVVLEKGRVLDADAAARSQGVVDGMRRGGVLTLAPNADLRERELTREEQTVRGVAFALLQFTPNVVIADENVVLADVTASLRLFGGLRALRRRVRRTVADVGVTSTASIAPTAEATWLIARAGGGVALTQRSLSRVLKRIPLGVLPAARRFAEWFDGLGCATIGDVTRLPRAGLKKRCGTALLDALDRAKGEAPEVHEWLTMPPAFDARVELPDRIEYVEATLFAARRLTLQMTGWLAARQLAVARFVVSLEHERGRDAIPPTDVEVALGEPTWHEEHLVRLLKERLSRIELAAERVFIGPQGKGSPGLSRCNRKNARKERDPLTTASHAQLGVWANGLSPFEHQRVGLPSSEGFGQSCASRSGCGCSGGSVGREAPGVPSASCTCWSTRAWRY
ncbi:DNA polymerase Y family protein [Paraburkholderia sp. CNPSo 3076]|uniref:Y-family DNA polymerase n=1 Tax=Paraburkholderia sp. CNPSo 3076 TaxID=2940936 RepID=UPI00224F4FD4|nr:DNA polymerase Y family protein [Paraburkholderia sp. CNPSo 3076]MCX5544165.1 DNA polymerase Y family protein [Paraburkholderia sp. CNPSo 3076]